MEKFVDWALAGAARVLIVFGGIWLAVQIPRDREREFSTSRANDNYGYGTVSPRFKTDTASGATAHAVEWLAKQTSPPLINNAIWLGFALWGLQSLRRTQHAMERLANKVAPLPASPTPSRDATN